MSSKVPPKRRKIVVLGSRSVGMSELIYHDVSPVFRLLRHIDMGFGIDRQILAHSPI